MITTVNTNKAECDHLWILFDKNNTFMFYLINFGDFSKYWNSEFDASNFFQTSWDRGNKSWEIWGMLQKQLFGTFCR